MAYTVFFALVSLNCLQSTNDIIVLYQSLLGSDYREGDIRLVGGVYSWEGRVEIYLNGEWGTISDDNYDRQNAHAACRQLGYDTQGEM